MANKIRIMIADDNLATRNNLRKLLDLEPDLEFVCEACNGDEAVRKASIMMPDVILMDINMPGMDGIAATEIISIDLPQCVVIVISVQGEQEYLRRAMTAGAKDYLVKPFESVELLDCVRTIYNREVKRREKSGIVTKKRSLGKVISIFSSKGGIGKTTIATNLAVALGLDEDNKVCIIDMDLHFGDVALFLNLIPNVTVAELLKETDVLDASLLDSYLTKYKDNVHVLASPLRPEFEKSVNGSQICNIIKEMQYQYDYIIIDTHSVMSDIVLNILDLSNTVLVTTSQDLPTLKNVKLCLEILESLNFSEEKLKIILNRANSAGGMSIKDAEDIIQRKFTASMPSDGKIVVTAINKGIPFVLSDPDTAVSQSIFRLANYVISGDQEYITSVNKTPKGKGIIGKTSDLLFNPKGKSKSAFKSIVDPSYWAPS